MDIALFHHFPLAGGAPRVLAEYATRSRASALTLYTRQPQRPGLLSLDPRVRVRRFAPFDDGSALARLRTLWTLPRRGRELAAEIDAGGHDAVFCHASFLVQSPEVLPYLRTPSLYYAPEPLRAAYDPSPEFGRVRSPRARLVDAGLDPYERRRRALDRRHIRAAPNVVTHSRYTQGRLAEVYGVRSAVVPLGVDSGRFTPGEAAREGYVLSVGALHPLKGHQFVIDALATLPAPRPRLVTIGDRGDLGPQLDELARERGVELEVRRGLSEAELVETYRRAAVMACGQVGEPFGLITLEAMATATPVVAVREGGLAETVYDGDTGLLVERDPEAFGAALARVLADPDLARRLGERGRVTAERDWTWERTVRGFDDLLERVAAGETVA